MNDIDSSNDNYTNDSNDKYSNVKYTNDSILTHILLFGKVSLDISANTLILTATMKYIISTNRFQKSLFLVFCNFLLYFHLFNFFPYPYVFFLRLYIHIHLVLRFAFIYLLTFFFTFSYGLYPSDSRIFKAPVNFLFDLFVCAIFIYKKSYHNLIYPFSLISSS